jgi:hypothetical protein
MAGMQILQEQKSALHFTGYTPPYLQRAVTTLRALFL